MQSLQAATAYPVPLETIEAIAARRSVELDSEATQELLTGSSYRLALADIYMWLFLAPDVTQGGQSYSLTDEQRKNFRRMALAIYGELEEEAEEGAGVTYGYKGDRL